MTFAGRVDRETGQVAKQANGSVVVRYGESTVLTAAVMSKKMQMGISSHSKSTTKKNVCGREISWWFYETGRTPFNGCTLKKGV